LFTVGRLQTLERDMAAQIDLTTTAGQIEWQKTIEKEYKTRASWMAKYGPEEYRPAPRMIKVKKVQRAETSPPAVAETGTKGSVTPMPVEEPSYTEVLKRMQFSTTTSDSFWNMHQTTLNSLARQSLQAGQFNRRKTMQTL
jgi:hypothetical protein